MRKKYITAKKIFCWEKIIRIRKKDLTIKKCFIVEKK